MTVNKNMIIQRIKANLDILKTVNQKVDTYKNKLERINGMLMVNPEKPSIEKLFGKQKSYQNIFLAILHEDLFFLMDCNAISVSNYQKYNGMLQENGLAHKEKQFYGMLKDNL